MTERIVATQEDELQNDEPSGTAGSATVHTAEADRELLAEVVVDADGRIQSINDEFAAAVDSEGELAGEMLPQVVACLGIAGEVAELHAQLMAGGSEMLVLDVCDPVSGGSDLVIKAFRTAKGGRFQFVPRLYGYRHRKGHLGAEKLAVSVIQVAGGVAHDFNNLITGIIGLASCLESDLPVDSAYRADLQEIVLAARKASSLARRLSTLGRKSSVEEVTVNPNHIVREVVHLVQPSFPVDCALETDLQWCGILRTDALALERIVLNLVLNARDACEAKGGTVTVLTRQVEQGAGSENSCLPPGDYFELSVVDDGPGISAAEMAQIFRPYYTTKQETGGEGLGLTASRSSAEQLGGELVVDSTPGDGACFTLRIPLR